MGNNLRRLQAGILSAILLFLWLAVVLLIIGVLGNLFNLSVMNSEIWQIFGMITGIIALLGFINIIISLNIISGSLATYSDSNEQSSKKVDYRKILIATLGLVVFVLGIQSIIKVQVDKKNMEILKQEVVDMSNSLIISKINTLVEEDAPMKELYFSRDSLLLSMKSNSITLLIPKVRDGNKVFYPVTPWDYDSKDERKISEALERPYIPSKDEKVKFDKMLKDRKGFELKRGSDIVIFHPIEKNGELKLILIMNSKTEINYEYLKERSSASLETKTEQTKK